MSRKTFQATFQRGEASPLIHTRRDLEAYQQLGRKLTNWVVTKYGGITRRPGTLKTGALYDESAPAVLIPFVNATTDAYAMEFGPNIIRPWSPVTDAWTGHVVASPYATADLDQLQYTQTQNAMFLAHRSYRPKVLRQLDDGTWTLTDMLFIDGPYLPINDIASNTVTTSAALTTGATVTLTWTGGVSLVAGDVDRWVRLQINGSWTWGQITAVLSPLSATFSVYYGTGQTGSSASWRLGAYSDAVGWPASVVFFEGRLIWGRANNDKRAVASSMSALPFVYSPSSADGTVTDEHGFYFSGIAGRGDEILWLLENARLQIGTAGAIRSMGAADFGQVMTPRNVNQRLETITGVSPTMPVQAGTAAMFAERFGRTMRDLYYDFNVNSLVDPANSDLSEHLFDAGVRRFAYQQVPSSITWMCTYDGGLLACTTDRAGKITGYTPCPISGAQVISICCVPGPTQDELWMVTKRGTTYHMEVMSPWFLRRDQAAAHFVDFGVDTAFQSPSAIIDGLDHLNGQEVSILGDGAVLPRQVVNNGRVVLAKPVRWAHVGLPIDCQGETMLPPITDGRGDILGNQTKVVRAWVDLYESRGIELYTNGSNGRERLVLRRGGDAMDRAPRVVTGVYGVTVDDSWDNDGSLLWSCPDPLPCTIRGILTRVEFED